MKSQTDKKECEDLVSAIHKINNFKDLYDFLEDLCTPAELRSMADRWRVAKLLSKGISYRNIYDQTGVSTATITRVARSMTYGSGGYQAALEKSSLEENP